MQELEMLKSQGTLKSPVLGALGALCKASWSQCQMDIQPPSHFVRGLKFNSRRKGIPTY